MTDPLDYSARIRAKGLDSTGVTQEIARQMYTHRGKHYLAIVEMKVDETHEKADGARKVDMVLTQVEPAVTEDLAEHLRELMRTVYFSRGVGDQLTLPAGSDEPTVDQVLAAGAKHRPHPFLPVDLGGTGDDQQPICDVCGLLEAAGVHSTQETLTGEEEDLEDLDGDLAEQEGVMTAEAKLEYAKRVAAQTRAEREQPPDEPWEYDAPEGATADPFKAPVEAASS